MKVIAGLGKGRGGGGGGESGRGWKARKGQATAGWWRVGGGEGEGERWWWGVWGGEVTFSLQVSARVFDGNGTI